MKLNLGCGTALGAREEGWINADVRSLPGVDLVCDARALPLEKDSVELILAQDLIEHIPMLDVLSTLKEWHRVLMPGGELQIRTPDFYKLARAAITRRLPPNEFFHLFFGDQSPEAGGYEAGGHKSGFSKEQWKQTLAEVGFDAIEVYDDEHEYNLYVKAKAKKEVADGKEDQEVQEQAVGVE